MAVAIDVAGLTKRYDQSVALDQVSFQVQDGEIMGFLGPNGAGKTTTMRILTGIIAPTAGTAKIAGYDIATQSIEVRRRIGYLPENVALYPELRVQEYLAYRAAIKDVPRSARPNRIKAALEQCDLADVSRKLIGRLSKGYRQRVGLADALLGQPKILILDEPTVGLDPHQIRQTRELIVRLGRTTTILLSTHILPEVEMACQRVAIIDKGKIIAVDAPAALRQRMRGMQLLRVEMRGDARAVKAGIAELPGITRVDEQGSSEGFTTYEVETEPGVDVREAIFRLAVVKQWGLRELSPQRASLEDIFIHLTTHE